MIEFRQKQFSEYDAMRSLYVELMKSASRDKFKVIDSKQLIPILKGNNVVIERFVISTSFARSDRYRMYLKVGAKAKMPDDVRLPGRVYDEKLLKVTFGFGGNTKQKQYSEIEFKQKEFKNNNKNNGGGGFDGVSGKLGTGDFEINKQVTALLGDAVEYDKASRSIVLEFTEDYGKSGIQKAIEALNILPFGLNYRIYLLDA